MPRSLYPGAFQATTSSVGGASMAELRLTCVGANGPPSADTRLRRLVEVLRDEPDVRAPLFTDAAPTFIPSFGRTGAPPTAGSDHAPGPCGGLANSTQVPSGVHPTSDALTKVGERCRCSAVRDEVHDVRAEARTAGCRDDERDASPSAKDRARFGGGVYGHDAIGD
jgi:hypothetical protein